jgi:hypothetical protein
MVLPVLVAQNHGRLVCRAEARSAHERHDNCLEVVRGDEHCPHGAFLTLAFPVSPDADGAAPS